MQIKTLKLHLTLAQNSYHQENKQKTTTNAGEDAGGNRTLVQCWKCKLVQPLWKSAWRFFKKL
jgi:hypothetical protein